MRQYLFTVYVHRQPGAAALPLLHTFYGRDIVRTEEVLFCKPTDAASKCLTIEHLKCQACRAGL